jgi:hypothetical protein
MQQVGLACTNINVRASRACLNDVYCIVMIAFVVLACLVFFSVHVINPTPRSCPQHKGRRVGKEVAARICHFFRVNDDPKVKNIAPNKRFH